MYTSDDFHVNLILNYLFYNVSSKCYVLFENPFRRISKTVVSHGAVLGEGESPVKEVVRLNLHPERWLSCQLLRKRPLLRSGMIVCRL